MDEAGRLLPPGERGEIVVRGPLVMAGYYKNPAATAEASRHGWHHTGDVGYLDADGYLYIVDRLKDMIITGGFNVYSAEVEQAVLAHPAVLDCAVVGLPDDKWGERVTAIIQPLDGQRGHRRGDPGLGQGPPRQREGPQAGRDLARPAPLPGRQDPQGRRQVPPARRLSIPPWRPALGRGEGGTAAGHRHTVLTVTTRNKQTGQKAHCGAFGSYSPHNETQ